MSSTALSPLYRKIRNVLIGLALLLTAILMVQLILNFLVMPRMRIGQVLLESTLPLSDESLLQLGGISGRVNYLTLDEKELQDSYESSPLIRKAYVQKQFPNTLKIVLYGRSPLGISYLEENGLEIPVVFDEQGVIFHKGSGIQDLDVPVISGIRYGAVQEGMALPEVLLPLFHDLKNLQDKEPLLFNQISEVRINRKNDEQYDLTLFLTSYSVPVVTNAFIDSALLKKILLVLDALEGQQIMTNLEYADFRSGQVVLKMREEG